MDDKTFKADKTIWDVGETVKEKKEPIWFLCPFRCGKNTSDRCQREACELWIPEKVTKIYGGSCSFTVMALGINKAFFANDE